MKTIISIILLGLALAPTLSFASVILTSDAETRSAAPVLVTATSSPSGFSGGTTLQNLTVSAAADSDVYDLEVARFTIRGDSDNLTDELIVTRPTTSGSSPTYVTSLTYVTTLTLSHGDEIAESQTISLSGAPEPARASLLAVGLGALSLRRRRR